MRPPDSSVRVGVVDRRHVDLVFFEVSVSHEYYARLIMAVPFGVVMALVMGQSADDKSRRVHQVMA